MVTRFAIKVAYLGQKYHGFQRQKTSIKTVEGTILTSLKKLNIINDLANARYNAAGRTDKGVNAIAQVMAFDSIQKKLYLEEINKKLPHDIFVYASTKVPELFNARRNAIRRTYRYYCPYYQQDIKLMRKALKKLKGTHDFIKLCKKPRAEPNGYQKSTIQTLQIAKVILNKTENLLEFEFTAQSFLWKQVRKMVSVILGVGAKNYPLEIVDNLLDPNSNQPNFGIQPAYPEGLILYEVEYDKIQFTPIKSKEIIESRLLKKHNIYSSLAKTLSLVKEKID